MQPNPYARTLLYVFSLFTLTEWCVSVYVTR